MKVINIHSRKIAQPKANMVELFKTLATKNDLMLATDKWPAMKLDKGMTIGSHGGHGLIRYFVEAYSPDGFVKFSFTRPKGFHGFHQFEIIALSDHQTEIKHTINMSTTGPALLTWPLVIRWLHDALIEDAFDKVENNFNEKKKITRWSLWVKFLRWVLNRKKLKQA
jgi:hypothetical protein